MVVKVVNKGLEVRLYPNENMVNVLNHNIGNARFTWNHLLDEYQKINSLFIHHNNKKIKVQHDYFQYYVEYA